MMRRTHAVPNPAIPRQLRPVELISDRAKRYRANRNPPAGPRRCAFCAKSGKLDIDHIDGDEANGHAWNPQYLCRSCNTKKGVVQTKAGEGRRTVQMNPAPVPTFRQYVDAVRILRGDVAGNARKAARTLQATLQAKREEFAGRIAQAKNPEPHTPTYAQYAYAVSIHRRGARDEGGKIIHATPPDIRSKYARRIAAGKRRKASEVPF
jgi:hypothetical protein